jgi:hypothetical protein
MRSKLFTKRPKTVQTGQGRWVRILPEDGQEYRLYDPLGELELGRILFDAADNWIYDGEVLDIDEQEDIAGVISGNHKEMNELLNQIQGK